jgi:Tol biopolymer transport system component
MHTSIRAALVRRSSLITLFLVLGTAVVSLGWGALARFATAPLQTAETRASDSIGATTPLPPGLLNLTQSEADEDNPAWSPQGNLIAFTSNGEDSNRDGRIDAPIDDSRIDPVIEDKRLLYTVERDGTNLIGYPTVTTGSVESISWQVDGLAMYIVIKERNPDNTNQIIYAIRKVTLATTTTPSTVTQVYPRAGVESLPIMTVASPNFTIVYFDRQDPTPDGPRWSIYLVSMSGGTPLNISVSQSDPAKCNSRRPVLANGRAELLFETDRIWDLPSPDLQLPRYAIWRMETNGAGQRRLTTPPPGAQDTHPAVTVDRDQPYLLYSSTRFTDLQTGVPDGGVDDTNHDRNIWMRLLSGTEADARTRYFADPASLSDEFGPTTNPFAGHADEFAFVSDCQDSQQDILIGTRYDAQAPFITSPAATWPQKIVTPRDTVRVTVPVVDLDTGVRYVWLQIKDPDPAALDIQGRDNIISVESVDRSSRFSPEYPYNENNRTDELINTKQPIDFAPFDPFTETHLDTSLEKNRPYYYSFPGSSNTVGVLDDYYDIPEGVGYPEVPAHWLRMYDDGPTGGHGDEIAHDGIYTCEWVTPNREVSGDWFFDIIVEDMCPRQQDRNLLWHGYRRRFDNVGGCSTQDHFIGGRRVLFVDDHIDGQQFLASGLQGVTMPGTDYRFASFLNSPYYYQFTGEERDDPDYSPFMPDSLIGGADIWRVLARGPVPEEVYRLYLPRQIMQPNPTLPEQLKATPHADNLLIWSAPHLWYRLIGSVREVRGTTAYVQRSGSLLDPETQTSLDGDFIRKGGRLLLMGPRLASSLTNGGTIAQVGTENPFLRDLFGVRYLAGGIKPGSDWSNPPPGATYFNMTPEAVLRQYYHNYGDQSLPPSPWVYFFWILNNVRYGPYLEDMFADFGANLVGVPNRYGVAKMWPDVQTHAPHNTTALSIMDDANHDHNILILNRNPSRAMYPSEDARKDSTGALLSYQPRYRTLAWDALLETSPASSSVYNIATDRAFAAWDAAGSGYPIHSPDGSALLGVSAELTPRVGQTAIHTRAVLWSFGYEHLSIAYRNRPVADTIRFLLDGGLSGKVMQINDLQPIANIKVVIGNVNNPTAVAWTDSRGEYLVQGLRPGNYSIYVDASQYMGNRNGGALVNGGQITPNNNFFLARDPERATLWGYITTNGTAVPYAVVSLTMPDTTVLSTRADLLGRYEFNNLEPNTLFTVTATHPITGQLKRTETDPTLTPGQRLRLDIDMFERQPDLSLVPAVGVEVGAKILNDTGANQVATQTLLGAGESGFTIRVTNPTTIPQKFTLTTVIDDPAWTINVQMAGQDITTLISRTIGWETPYITAGNSLNLALSVSSPAALTLGGSLVTITAHGGRSLDVVKAQTLVHNLQPDLLIRRATDPDWAYLGDNVFNVVDLGLPPLQTRPRAKAIFYAKLQNAGLVAGAYRLHGTAGVTGLWTVDYFDAEVAGTNITAMVTGAGWVSPMLASGSEKLIRIEVMPTSLVPPFVERSGHREANTYQVDLIATVDTDPTSTDTVQMTTEVIPAMHPDLLVRAYPDLTYGGDSEYAPQVQLFSRTVSREMTAVFLVRLQNDGNQECPYTLQVSPGDANWAVRLYDTAGNDYTVQATAGGWTTPTIPAGGDILLYLEVTPGLLVPLHEKRTINMTATQAAGTERATDRITAEVTVAGPQPDLLIRSAAGTEIGDGIYEGQTAEPPAQSVATLYTDPGVPLSFFVRVKNDGTAADRFLIAGTPGVTTGWEIAYFDVTDAVVALDKEQINSRGWTTPTIALGGSRLLRIDLNPSWGTAIGINQVIMSAASVSDPTSVDTIGFSVGVNVRPRPALGIGLTNQVFNSTASQAIAPGTVGTYYLRLKNEGNSSGRFMLSGDSVATGWIVKYFYPSNTRTEITSDVISAAGWRSPVVVADTTPDIENDHCLFVKVELTLLQPALPVLPVESTLSLGLHLALATDISLVSSVTAQAIPVVLRPDIMLKTAAGAYQGSGIAPPVARISEVVDAGVPAVYHWKLLNQGNAAAPFTLTGTPSGPEWQVRYFDALVDGNDITTRVTGAGWSTPSPLAPGGAYEGRLEVTPLATLSGGSFCEATLTARSSQGRQDQVQAITSVRSHQQVLMLLYAYGEPASVSTNISRLLPPGGTAIYQVRLANLGNVAAAMRLRDISATLGAGWTVRYLDPHGDDITTAVVSATGWLSPVLAREQVIELRLLVGAASTLGSGASQLTDLSVTTESTDATVDPATAGAHASTLIHGRTIRLSVNGDGQQTDGESGTWGSAAISADGRFLVFASQGSSLVPGDRNGQWDVFRLDRQSWTITRVSLPDPSTGEAEANGPSGQYGVAVSADGRYVAFRSQASNLVAGDTNGKWDIFLRDCQLNMTTCLSRAYHGGNSNGDSGYYGLAMSADGQIVTYESMATNLVDGDTNGARDIFVYDRTDRTTTCVSRAAGVQANRQSLFPSVTADGTRVVFASEATNLVAGDTNGVSDVFLMDRRTGAVTLVSVRAGSDTAPANERSSTPHVSADGRRVVFESIATNLTAGDTNNMWDIYLRDLTTRTTTRVSVGCATPGGPVTESNGLSFGPALSPDGGFVVFRSQATNLVSNDTNGKWDVFVHRLADGVTERVSLSTQGAQGTGDSGFHGISISQNGRYVAFTSSAANLITGDTNGVADVFVHDRLPAAVLQPDLRYRVEGVTALAGDNRYLLDDQTERYTLDNGPVARYRVSVQNDGATTERIRLQGSGGATGWTVRYLLGTVEITDAVTGAGWESPELIGGASVDLFVEVTPAATTRRGEILETFLMATSTLEYGHGDAMRFITTQGQLTAVNLTVAPSSRSAVNRPVSLTAETIGGDDSRYQFRLGTRSGNTWVWSVLRGYAATPTYTWTPAAEGSYALVVWARDADSVRTYDVYQSVSHTVTAALARVTLAIAPKLPQAVGTAVTLTATPTGGANVDYQFRAGYKSGTSWVWTVVQPYSPATTARWTPEVARTWSLVVYAREGGSTRTYDVYGSAALTVYQAPTSVSLVATPVAGRVGTLATLTATAQGSASVEYKFRRGLRVNGTLVWTTLRDYAPGNSCPWTPAAPGDYILAVYARGVGSLSAYDRYKTIIYTVQ